MSLKSEVLGIKIGDVNQRSIGAGLPEGSENCGFLKVYFLRASKDSGKEDDERAGSRHSLGALTCKILSSSASTSTKAPSPPALAAGPIRVSL